MVAVFRIRHRCSRTYRDRKLVTCPELGEAYYDQWTTEDFKHGPHWLTKNSGFQRASELEAKKTNDCGELGQVRDQRSVKPEMTHENQDWLTSCLDACERY
jgi:hypothetical protein